MRERLSWFWHRYQSMHRGEVAFRLHEWQTKRRDQAGFACPPVSEKILEQPLPQLGLLNQESISVTAWQQLETDVERILREEWSLLGVQRPAGSRCAWGVDPSSGKQWPMDQSGMSIDYRHDFKGLDIKLAWEHLKLQHLQLVAAAASRDSSIREVLEHDLRSWLALAPFKGIGYAAGIECALRLLSVLIILEWHPQWPEDLHRQLWQRLHDLHQWILRYPSLHSSGNNHRVAEVTACFVIECLVPQWRPITLAARSAQLTRRLEQQFHSDGVGTEQAPYYQALVTEWMVLASRVGQRHDAPLSIDALLQRSLSFLSELLDCRGNWPNIGDADDSVVVRTQLAPEPYVASIVSLAAAHLGQPAPSVQRNLRHSILGLDAAELRKISTSRCFNHGGFSVLRSGPVQLFFDHGPLGFGTLPGHGHADALSVWMQVNGRPVWVDTGTGSYNRDPQWRSWIRSTSAHNTVTIDGNDQSTQTGPFNWANHATAKLLSFSDHQGTVSAEHDGYKRIGVIHRRELALSSEAVLICDQLTGTGARNAVSRISLDPSLCVEPIARGWKVLDGDRVVATATVNTDSLRPVCARQSGEAAPGCYSLNYNHTEPTTTLQWEGRLQLPARWQLEWRWMIPTEEL